MGTSGSSTRRAIPLAPGIESATERPKKARQPASEEGRGTPPPRAISREDGDDRVLLRRQRLVLCRFASWRCWPTPIASSTTFLKTRDLAQAELDTLALHEKRVEDLEADRDTLLRDVADMVTETLDGLSGEERHRVYWMLRIEVTPIPEGFRVSGAFSDTFRSFGPTGRRRSESTKQTELRFWALLTEGDSQVIFHREGFGRIKEDFAWGPR